MHCRIPLKTQLYIDEWQVALQGYWESQFIKLLLFGFPLGFDRNSTVLFDNKIIHTLLTFLLTVVFLNEEIQFGAILGPFPTDPIPGCHKSSFMIREKPNVA